MLRDQWIFTIEEGTAFRTRYFEYCNLRFYRIVAQWARAFPVQLHPVRGCVNVGIEYPLLYIRMSFILICVSLGYFSARAFFTSHNGLLRFLRNNFLFSCCCSLSCKYNFDLRLLPGHVRVSLFHAFRPVKSTVSGPTFVRVAGFKAGVIRLFFPGIIGLAPQLRYLCVGAYYSRGLAFL